MRLFAPLAALLLVAGAAAAQDAPPPAHMTPMQRFQAANTTNDGKLTREQAQAAGMHKVAHNFDAIDVDHKGYVTVQDLHTWMQAQHALKMQQQAVPPLQ